MIFLLERLLEAPSLRRGFGLMFGRFALFPIFDIRQLPAGAAGAQSDRFGEVRVLFDTAPGPRLVIAVACGKLHIGEIDFLHRTPQSLRCGVNHF